MLATQEQPREVTQLLLAWNEGDESALERLVPLVYNELRRLAKRRVRLERPDHTLQTTALINEAYLRLVDVRNVHWQNRAHFFALCARLMRRILVDYARTRHYAKRGGGAQPISLDQSLPVGRGVRRTWWRSTMRCALLPKSMPEKPRWWSCVFLAG